MTVPVINTGARAITLAQLSPLDAVGVAVSGSFLAADNRTWTLDRGKNGTDITRLNSLLKRNQGTIGGGHARNVAELLPQLT